MRKAASFSSPWGPLSQTLCYNREPAWMGQCEGPTSSPCRHSPAPVLGPSVPGAGSGPWGHGAGGAPSPEAVSAPSHCWLEGPEPKALETAVHQGEGAAAGAQRWCSRLSHIEMPPKKRCFLQVMGFPYQRARSDVVLGVPVRETWLCPERSPSAPSPPACPWPPGSMRATTLHFQRFPRNSSFLHQAAFCCHGALGRPPWCCMDAEEELGGQR